MQKWVYGPKQSNTQPQNHVMAFSPAHLFILLSAGWFRPRPWAVLLVQVSQNGSVDRRVSGLLSRSERDDGMKLLRGVVCHSNWKQQKCGTFLTFETMVGLHCLRVNGSICWFLAFCPSACVKKKKSLHTQTICIFCLDFPHFNVYLLIVPNQHLHWVQTYHKGFLWFHNVPASVPLIDVAAQRKRKIGKNPITSE